MACSRGGGGLHLYWAAPSRGQLSKSDIPLLRIPSRSEDMRTAMRPIESRRGLSSEERRVASLLFPVNNALMGCDSIFAGAARVEAALANYTSRMFRSRFYGHRGRMFVLFNWWFTETQQTPSL